MDEILIQIACVAVGACIGWVIGSMIVAWRERREFKRMSDEHVGRAYKQACDTIIRTAMKEREERGTPPP